MQCTWMISILPRHEINSSSFVPEPVSMRLISAQAIGQKEMDKFVTTR